jgi:integrase
MLAIDETWLDLKAKTLTVPSRWRKERGGDLVIPLLDDEVKLFREQLLARGGPSSLVFPRRHGTKWTHSNYWHKVLVPARGKAAAAWREAHGLAADADTPFEWTIVDEHGTPVLDDDGEPKTGGLAPHDFRRGAATLLPELGMPHEVAAKRLGHKDAGQLLAERYETVRAERLTDEVARIDAAGGVW